MFRLVSIAVPALCLALGVSSAAFAREGHAIPPPPSPPKYETPIHAAAMEGDAARVLQLIDNGWDINTVSPVREDTPLFAAIDGKHTEVVNALLDRGASVTALGLGNSTPLHHAAIWGDTAVIGRLLALGANASHLDDSHRLPLTYAVERGFLDASKLLLVSPDLMDKSDSHDKTVLDHAVDLGDPEIALVLLRGGAHFADNPEHTLNRIGRCATKGWTEAIEIAFRQTESDPKLHHRIAERAYNDTFAAGNVPLLRRIGELVPGIGATKPNSGLPRLFIAANFGHLDMVALLLDQGADVDEQAEPSRWTPLHGATMDDGSLELVQFLLDKNANPNLQDGMGRTPLHAAAITGRPLVVAALLNGGADPSITDQLGNTALHYAVQTGSMAEVRALLDAHSTNVANNFGKKPYDVAIDLGRADFAAVLPPPPPVVLEPLPMGFEDLTELAVQRAPESLLTVRENWAVHIRRGVPMLHLAAQYGALAAVEEALASDPGSATARDPAHFLALHYAAEFGDPDIVHALLEAGAPMNDQANLAKWTPLHFAVSSGRASVVRVLLEAGADKSLPDGLGLTPAELAVLEGHADVADLLQ